MRDNTTKQQQKAPDKAITPRVSLVTGGRCVPGSDTGTVTPRRSKRLSFSSFSSSSSLRPRSPKHRKQCSHTPHSRLVRHYLLNSTPLPLVYVYDALVHIYLFIIPILSHSHHFVVFYPGGDTSAARAHPRLHTSRDSPLETPRDAGVRPAAPGAAARR